MPSASWRRVLRNNTARDNLVLRTLQSSKVKGSLVAMPRGSALFALLHLITVCLHTVKIHLWMLWLTTIMQRPVVARRTIAIELLRRLDQLEDDIPRSRSTPPSTPPHPRSANAIHEDKRLTSMKLGCRGQDCQPSSCMTHPQFPPKQNGYTQITMSCAATPDSSDSSDGTSHKGLVTHDARTPSAKSNSSRGVWADTWPTDPQDLNRLQIRAKQNTRTGAAGARPKTSASHWKNAILRCLPPNALRHVAPSQRDHQLAVGENARIGAAQVREDDCTKRPYSPFDSDATPLLADFKFPASDVTSTEGYHPSSPLSGTWDPSLDDTVGGAKDRNFGSPDQTKVGIFDRVFSVVDEPCRPQDCRNDDSFDSKPNTPKTPSVTLRAQSKANGGLLEFRANATRLKGPKPPRTHRRNVSITLPIRPSPSQPRGIQRSPPPPSTSGMLTPTPSSKPTKIATQIEQELQYKYRHIFIGTASLHSFLEVLETSAPGTTTSKPAILKAFTTLASNEQLLFRQASCSPVDWNLVSRTTPDISTFDCITLARVQLGSVSLQLFVDLVPFDSYNRASTALVVDAFKIASYVDAQACRNTGNKARALRMCVLADASPPA